MKIEILGMGCAKCQALEAGARKAAEKLGIPYEIRKVTDLNEIIQRGIMVTPALAIDGKVIAAGKVVSESELVSLLSATAAAPGS